MINTLKKNKQSFFYLNNTVFSFCIIIFLALVLQSNEIYTKTNDFDEQSAYATIKTLSSEEYQGRFPGSSGNDKTKEFIQNHFVKYNIPSELHHFYAYIPVWKGKPELKVIDTNGNTIKSYIYRKEYRTITSGLAQGGSITSIASSVENSQDITTASTSLLLASSSLNSIDDFFLKKNNIRAIINPHDTLTISRKSGVIQIDKLNEKCLIKIQVIDSVFRELYRFTTVYKYRIYINIPFKFEKIPEQNIYAVFNKEFRLAIDFSKPTLIISAHFDHLGTDPDGAYFPGALDNASGLATMLELAVSLQKYKELLTIQILFIAFNAEEEGLLGSWAFSKDFTPKNRNTSIINIDMVGAKEKVPLSFVYNESFYKQTPLLIEKLMNFFRLNTIEINEVSSSNLSDHYSFGYNWKIAAVTINEFPLSHYHTINDTAENTIDINRLDLIGEMLIKFIKEQYVNNAE